MGLNRNEPKQAAEILTLSEAIEELWRVTRTKVEFLLRHKNNPTQLQEFNVQIGKTASRVQELLEQSEAETTLDEQIEEYARKRNLPIIAAQARILPHLGEQERRRLERNLQEYFSRLNIPALVEQGDDGKIDSVVKTLKILRNEGFLDYIAIHGAYFPYDRAGKTAPGINRGNAVQKHIDEWRRERRKIVHNLPRRPNEELVLERALPEAKDFLDRLKRDDKDEYAKAMTLLTRTILMGDAVKKFTMKSWKGGRPENEGMDCDENTIFGQTLSLATDTEIHEPFEINGHVALRLNGFPLVFDVYDNRIRTIEECARKVQYLSDSPEGKAPSYYYRTPTVEARARYDAEGKVTSYEHVADHPYTLAEYDDIVSVLTGQAHYFQNIGDWKTAERIHQFALRVDPRSSKALTNLSRVAERLGDYNAARSHAEDALRIEGHNTVAHLNLGVAIERMGDMDGAAAECEKAIRIDPNYASAYENLSKIRQRQGNRVDEMKLLEKAVGLDPNNVACLNNLAVLLMKTGNTSDDKRAEEYLKKAIELNPHDGFALKNLGRLCVRYNALGTASMLFELAVREHPEDIDLRNDRLKLFKRLHQNNFAIDECREIIRLDPRHSPTFNTLGILLDHENQPLEAEKIYRQGLDVDPHNQDLHNNLALVLLHSHGQLVEAERHFRQAIAIDPALAYAHLNLADVLARTSRSDESRVELEEYVQLGGSPDHMIYRRIKEITEK